MGGFHILLVNLKILYKKYGLLGLRGWWIKSDIIADGSVNKPLEGRHYYYYYFYFLKKEIGLLSHKYIKSIRLLTLFKRYAIT